MQFLNERYPAKPKLKFKNAPAEVAISNIYCQFFLLREFVSVLIYAREGADCISKPNIRRPDNKDVAVVVDDDSDDDDNDDDGDDDDGGDDEIY